MGDLAQFLIARLVNCCNTSVGMPTLKEESVGNILLAWPGLGDETPVAEGVLRASPIAEGVLHGPRTARYPQTMGHEYCNMFNNLAVD